MAVWDAGHYTCEAINQAGRSEKHFSLHVWGEVQVPWRRDTYLSPRIQASLPLPLPLTLPYPSPTPTPVCSEPVPPAFPSKESYTLTVTEGQTARLSCDCQGIPFPKISWRKDGRMATPTQCPSPSAPHPA